VTEIWKCREKRRLGQCSGSIGDCEWMPLFYYVCVCDNVVWDLSRT